MIDAKPDKMIVAAHMSTTLPFTAPTPSIQFSQRAFCFTGKFYCGTRNWCENQISLRGGIVSTVRKGLDYLVIGEIGSRDWIHSTHGRKIERAVSYNDDGCKIAIVSEQHWHSNLH